MLTASRRLTNMVAMSRGVGEMWTAAAATGGNRLVDVNKIGGMTAQNKALSTSAHLTSTRQTYQPCPPLPVPDPALTLKKFVEFSEAVMDRRDHNETIKIVQQFIDGDLPELQAALEKRAKEMHNWLTPWWLEHAYLACPSPLPVITSPGVMFPPMDYNGQEGTVDAAAKITQAALMFHQRVEGNLLPQDMAGKAPMDMSQYRFLFGTTRIPTPALGESDQIRYGCDNQNKQRHIVVMCNGHLHRVEVLDKQHQLLSLDQLKQQFNQVIANSQDKVGHNVPIGSSTDRVTWGQIYKSLKANPTNSSHISTVEDALFVVCLDRETQPKFGYSEKDEAARQCLTGGGSSKKGQNSGNRWFDKTIQFVIRPDGYNGMTYEHTPAEGPPLAMLMDYICDQIDQSTFVQSGSAPVAPPTRLDFVDIDEKTQKKLDKAERRMQEVADDLDVMCYTFTRFGKNFPKSAKISPDSFIQVAFQLAYHKIHGVLPGSYETATLRKFTDGRTENIRSPNKHMTEFVKKVREGKRPVAELYELLKAATDAHKRYTLDCMNGAGMDRHLMAWNRLSIEKFNKPTILVDSPSFKYMQEMHISTSQVPTRHFIQMCFGPATATGYGICYNPQETELHFTISAQKSGGVSLKKFPAALKDALSVMKSICDKAKKEQSKL